MLKSTHALTKAAMLVMAEHWPQPLHFEQLCTLARHRLHQGADPLPPSDGTSVDLLAGELLSAYTVGVVELRPRELRFTRQPGSRPVASAVARWLARQGPAARVVNLRHEPVTLSELQRQVLQRLDGDHDAELLLNELMAVFQAGALNVEQGGNKVSDPAAVRPLLADLIAEALPALAAMALLER
jgi:methyltransferase-like protein